MTIITVIEEPKCKNSKDILPFTKSQHVDSINQQPTTNNQTPRSNNSAVTDRVVFRDETFCPFEPYILAVVQLEWFIEVVPKTPR